MQIMQRQSGKVLKMKVMMKFSTKVFQVVAEIPGTEIKSKQPKSNSTFAPLHS